MSFPTYPRYKRTGNDWLSEVPERWTLTRFSRVVAKIKDGTHGTFARTLEGKPLLSAKNVGVGTINITDDESLISNEDHADIVANGFPASGDLLLTIVGSIGRAAVYTYQEPLAFQRSVCFVRLASGHCSRFYYYFTQSKFFQEQLQSRSKSAAQSGVYMGDVVAIPVVCPERPEEQRAIAAFLDRETAKIDALVEEQKRLVELLKEKRQAVISQAVTKGLDPNVPAKDSGVPWLGKVPAHWAICQSRRLFAVRSEPALPTDRMLTASQKYGVLFQSDFVELEGRRVVEVILGVENLRHVEPDDFIISMRSFQGGIEWCTLRGSTSFHYVMLRPLKHVHPPFFAHLLKSSTYVQALRATTDLIRDGQELRYSNFVQVPLPVLPIDEQAEIARFLDHEVAKIDALTAESAKVIELLLERRSALISAAVTGKIDVRGIARHPEGATA